MSVDVTGTGGHSRVWRVRESALSPNPVAAAKNPSREGENHRGQELSRIEGAPTAQKTMSRNESHRGSECLGDRDAATQKGTTSPGERRSGPFMVRECWEIPIVYEDAHLMAVNKPARLLTSPDRYDRERPNLMKLLHQEIARGAGWVRERGLTYLANAHRLDFETSGLLLLAKDKPTLVALAELFGSLKPVKIYVALIHGTPKEAHFEVDAKLAPHPRRPGLMRVDHKHGKMSKTVFQVREYFRDYTLLDCLPLTGRTHQIRVHLQYAKLALVADPLYGGPALWLSEIKKRFRLREGHAEKALLSRVALHAEKLALKHPVTGMELCLEAPWSKDLTVAIKYLRKYGASRDPANPEEFPAENATPSA